jgi:hypothetical protein
MRRFTCDFETTTDLNDCRVWAYALCEIGNPDNFIYGNKIDDLIEWCKEQKDNVALYFHNLKFDGAFITYYLETHGYSWIPEVKEAEDNTYSTLITNMGAWYSIEIFFKVKGKHRNKVTIYDSLKILNMPVEKIAEGFDLPIRKLELDYTTYREPGHKLTQHEIDYIRNDVEIVARALDVLFKQGHTKMTIGSDALAHFKSMCPDFRNLFPVLELDIDRDIRQSYKGGFTYLNPLYKEKEGGSGWVLDVNSLYPSILATKPLPVRLPVPFENKYEYDPQYPLYVQSLSCRFQIKPGKIPSIQIKSHFAFRPNEYLESSDGKLVNLMLTNPDLELFYEQYDVYDEQWQGGWKFQSVEGLFADFIGYWTEQKIKAKKEKNAAQYQISKIIMNSTYGKFGTNPLGAKKRPYIADDGAIHELYLDIEERKPIYVPVASFTTSYARCKTIRTSQAIRDWSLKNKGYDAYVYSDTDSIHVSRLNYNDFVPLKDIIEIDDYKLGAWKVESRYWRSKYLRQKTYCELQPNGKMNVVVAGLPKKLSHLVNFDNFKLGFNTADFTDEEVGEKGRKLTYKHVPGGVVLVPTDFSIN